MKKRNEKNDNIILTMIDFFIEEMCDSGTATIEEITEMYNEGKENEFRKMVREYKKLQNVTRSKANKAIIKLKKENKHLLELQKDMDKQYEELESVNYEIRKYINQLTYDDLKPIEIQVIEYILNKGDK